MLTLADVAKRESREDILKTGVRLTVSWIAREEKYIGRDAKQTHDKQHQSYVLQELEVKCDANTILLEIGMSNWPTTTSPASACSAEWVLSVKLITT